MFERTSTKFLLTELDTLHGQGKLEKFVDQFQAIVTRAYVTLGQRVPQRVNAFIDPIVENNVVRHEYEHLQNIPAEKRNLPVIEFTVVQSLFGEYIGAACVLPLEEFSYEELATVFAAPRSLSEEDVKMAEYFAEKTGNEEFVAKISKELSGKKRHGRYGILRE